MVITKNMAPVFNCYSTVRNDCSQICKKANKACPMANFLLGKRSKPTVQEMTQFAENYVPARNRSINKFGDSLNLPNADKMSTKEKVAKIMEVISKQ